MPCHEALTASGVMRALVPLLSSPHAPVAEHAASAFAILANNPDTHFTVRHLETIDM